MRQFHFNDFVNIVNIIICVVKEATVKSSRLVHNSIVVLIMSEVRVAPLVSELLSINRLLEPLKVLLTLLDEGLTPFEQL